MADDFRVTVELEDERSILHFGRSLREREFEQELREQLGQGVVVTHDGPRVFLYAETRAQAEAADRAVREVLAHQAITADVSPVMRWHPVEKRWEDASVALPETAEEVERERVRWEQQQMAEAQETGYLDWEVRVDLPSHGDAVELAERLESESIGPIVRRWKYLLVGAATEADAHALAGRIRAEVPAGADVRAEASATLGWELTGSNPFVPFGAFGPRP